MLGCTHAEGELLLQRITTSTVLEASSCYLHEEITSPLGRAAACSCLWTEQRLHPALSAACTMQTMRVRMFYSHTQHQSEIEPKSYYIPEVKG